MRTPITSLLQPILVEGLLIEERMRSGAAFNPIAADMRSDPYPAYRQLRERDPVHWSEILEGWVLTRYADVSAVFREPRFSSQTIPARLPESVLNTPAIRRYFESMSKAAPADHVRLRELVSKAFTPRSVEELRSRVNEIIAQLLTALTPQGHMDVVDDFANVLPVTVIADMLGIPPEDRVEFKRWSDSIAQMTEPQLTPELLHEIEQTEDSLIAYLRPILDQRRREPQADLISGLVTAEDQGNKLTEDEALETIILLLVAGNETTTNLIGAGLLSLLHHPDQLQRLRDDPTLMESAVEELLRYESPVQMSWRVANEDVDIAGKKVRAGQSVILIMAAANRDPEAFPNPDTLDLGRKGERHLAFGFGGHYCLGSWLARLEGSLAFEALIRLPDLQLAGGYEWGDKVRFRGLSKLPVSFAAGPLPE